MRKLTSKLAGQQSGFTLIELVIVIVIIGILSAAAIPNLTGAVDEAKAAQRTAVLGMVKTAWGLAYAVAKTTPTGSQIITETLDPVCTASCCGGAAIALPASVIAKPSDIICTNCTVVAGVLPAACT